MDLVDIRVTVDAMELLVRVHNTAYQRIQVNRLLDGSLGANRRYAVTSTEKGSFLPLNDNSVQTWVPYGAKYFRSKGEGFGTHHPCSWGGKRLAASIR